MNWASYNYQVGRSVKRARCYSEEEFISANFYFDRTIQVSLCWSEFKVGGGGRRIGLSVEAGGAEHGLTKCGQVLPG